MKFLKKASVGALVAMMAITGFVVKNNTKAYAAGTTDGIKKLITGKTYTYDLDGDNKKDTIKVYLEQGEKAGTGKIMLKVNKNKKVLIPDYNKEAYYYNVKIFDLNKKDNSSEIILNTKVASDTCTTIIKYKGDELKINKSYGDGDITSYNDNTGMVTLEEADRGRYSQFYYAIGNFSVYDKFRVDGYKVHNQYTAKTTPYVRNHTYIAAKALTAYTNTKDNKKAFTIKKNEKVHINALYKRGDIKYIQVKNAKGNMGFVKVNVSYKTVNKYPANLMFTKSSCIWWR